MISESTWLLPPTDVKATRQGAAKRKSTISEFAVEAKVLVERLSFTHLVDLSTIDDSFKRAFYEVECVRGNWSVRELRY